MGSNKFERIIYRLLRILGVITIMAAYLCKDGLFGKEGLIVLKHKTIIGNIFMISPRYIVEMIVTIVLYLIFIRLVSRHISISKKST